MTNKHDNDNQLLEGVGIDLIDAVDESYLQVKTWSAAKCAKRLGAVAGLAAAVAWYFSSGNATITKRAAPQAASSAPYECTAEAHLPEKHMHYYNGMPIFGQNDHIYLSENGIDVSLSDREPFMPAKFSDDTALHGLQKALGSKSSVLFYKGGFTIAQCEFNDAGYFQYTTNASYQNSIGQRVYPRESLGILSNGGAFYESCDYDGDGTIDYYFPSLGMGKENANIVASVYKEKFLVAKVKAVYNQLVFDEFPR